MTRTELEQIALAHYREIYTFCLQRVRYNEQLASDLAQDVFLLLQERHGSLADGHIRAWLYSVADKKVKEAYKTAQKNEKVVSIEQTNLEIPFDCDLLALLEKSIPDDEIEHCKATVLGHLTPKEKDLYTEIYVNRKKYREITAAYQTTEKAIRLRAFRLRKRIRELSRTMF